MTLRRCPCGKVPDGFEIVETASCRWKFAQANCCHEWMFEFRSQYGATQEQEQEYAGEAWNDMPRNEECDDR